MHALVHAADVQDTVGDSAASLLGESRDGGVLLL